MSDGSNDFVRWVGFALVGACMNPTAARAFERRMRKEFGGTRHYISKRTPTAAPPERENRSTSVLNPRRGV